jgi:hypothetical protein
MSPQMQMRPQIHTTEVSTNIPSKEFININLPWYRENSCIYSIQTIYPLSSEPGDKPFYWAQIGPLHVNWGGLISVVLYPSIDEILQIDSIDTLTNRLESFLAEKLIAIPGVEYVFLSLENDSIDIWTVISKLDREIRAKIYDVEYDILDIIKGFQFDFHVICRNDRSIEDLYPSNTKMIFQK